MATTIIDFIKKANEWAENIDFGSVTKNEIIREMNRIIGGKMQIRVTVEESDGTRKDQPGQDGGRKDPFRILIAAQDGPISTELQINCNPIVIEISPGRARLLAVGSERLIRYNYRTICDYAPFRNGNLPEKTVVLPVYEGTVITIYWYRGQWTIATAHGYDVNHFEWITGGVTYGDVFAELMPKNVLDSLNHKWCYTFGFRHEAFHPIINDPMNRKIWFMSRTNVASSRQINLRTLPDGSPIHSMTMKAIDPTREFGKVSSPPKRMAILCRDAYLDCANNKRFNYGYIIRVPGSAPVLCESTLLSFVRRAFYEIPFVAKRAADPVERRNWILLSAFMAYDSDLLEWWQLSEPFREELKIIQDRMQKLRTCTLAALSDHRYADHLKTQPDGDIEKLALYYYNSLKRHVRKGADNETLVRDRTVEEKNLTLLAPLLS